MNSSVTKRRLPAEWEPQAGVMLTWPHANSDWVDKLAQVDALFLHLAEAIAVRQPLLINLPDPARIEPIRSALLAMNIAASQLKFSVVPSNDTWARDHGPLTVLEDGQPRLLDFQFNGWGNKYPSEHDNAINRRLAAAACFGAVPMDSLDMVLEGGSLDSDGQGSLLTTSSCQRHPQRNPDLSRQDIDARFKAYFGAERVLWLEHGCLEGDDTDGHVDMLARFSDPHTLLYQSCDEPTYTCYAALQAMQCELQAFRDARGQAYRLLALPWPQPQLDKHGQRLPASYANFLVINGAVLLPVYADPADALAAQRLQQTFPHLDIVPIDCRTLIQQHGSLHCVTMQFPVGVEIRSGNEGQEPVGFRQS